MEDAIVGGVKPSNMAVSNKNDGGDTASTNYENPVLGFVVFFAAIVASQIANAFISPYFPQIIEAIKGVIK